MRIKIFLTAILSMLSFNLLAADDNTIVETTYYGRRASGSMYNPCAGRTDRICAIKRHILKDGEITKVDIVLYDPDGFIINRESYISTESVPVLQEQIIYDEITNGAEITKEYKE